MVTLAAVGDILLALGMRRLLQRYGAEYPFRRIRQQLVGADILIGNLEAPLTARNTPTPYKNAESVRARRDYILRAEPSAARGLVFAGFDAVGLANNHTMDYREGGLLDTLSVLNSLGIAYAGAGRNLFEARRPAILERKEGRVALFSYSTILPAGSVATPSRAGIAPARGYGVEAMIREDLAEACRQADWVVVSIHWGKQLARYPDQRQQQLGRRLVDWGADAVLGHHPHVLQGIEVYRGKIIAYSLGDFVNLSSRRETALLQLTLQQAHTITAACILPLELENGQLHPPTGRFWKAVIARMNHLSAPWGTYIDPFGWITVT